MEYLRVEEEETHADNIELPTDNDKTETETYNWASIPDEVDSIQEEWSAEESKERELIGRNTYTPNDFVKRCSIAEKSKRADSIDINSIFCSDSISNESQTKTYVTDKDYFEICKELNDMAVDLIKQGIRIQESENEDSECDEDQNDRALRAIDSFQQAKSYLNAWLKHSYNIKNFDTAYIATFHYNLAWLYQKLPQLEEWSYHLDEVIKIIEGHLPNNLMSELNKLKYMTKFQLQQCAIKSQLDNNIGALKHGNMSVKNCHNLISKTYQIWKFKISNEIKLKQQKKLKQAFCQRQESLDSSDFEYGPKNILNKKKHTNLDKSKYFKSNKNNGTELKKRRCLSEENTSNRSINLSARKVVLNRQKGSSRNNSLESVHTFYLKQSPSMQQLKKSNSNVSLNSQKCHEESRKYELADDYSDNGSQTIYVEERVKMLKNSRHKQIYKSLQELCKQIKEFKAIYQLENDKRIKYFNSNKHAKKDLWISFSDEEEINQIIKDDLFKINTRSVLGVKNNNDWIYGLNIGNIMHLGPLLFSELISEIKWEKLEDKLDWELTNNSILEKITYLASAYFCIATELRFMNKKRGDKDFPK